MHEAGQHVSALDVEVVERAEHVGGDDRREKHAVLHRVRAVHHVDHALRVLYEYKYLSLHEWVGPHMETVEWLYYY